MSQSSFPTPVLDRQLARQRQQWERDRRTVLAAAQTWLAAHAQQFGITEGYLVGSITQAGRFSQQSDLDMAVPTLSQGDPFGLASHLSLHIDREVDVVPLDQCHFADKISRTGLQWSTNRCRTQSRTDGPVALNSASI